MAPTSASASAASVTERETRRSCDSLCATTERCEQGLGGAMSSQRPWSLKRFGEIRKFEPPKVHRTAPRVHRIAPLLHSGTQTKARGWWRTRPFAPRASRMVYPADEAAQALDLSPYRAAPVLRRNESAGSRDVAAMRRTDRGHIIGGSSNSFFSNLRDLSDVMRMSGWGAKGHLSKRAEETTSALKHNSPVTCSVPHSPSECSIISPTHCRPGFP